MEPISTLAAGKESLGALSKKDLELQSTKSHIEKLTPVRLFHGSHFEVNALVENIPLGERTVGFFSAPEFHELSVMRHSNIEGVQIRLAGKEFNFSLQEGDYLDSIGINNLIIYAMSPAVEQFRQVRLEELKHSETSALHRLEKIKPSLPTPLAVAIHPSQAGEFLGEVEKLSTSLDELEKPLWFSAKRIDYLVGDQYVEGKVCNLPIVGGASNLYFKSRLGVEMEGGDWAKLGGDVVMVISLAALPFAPGAGLLARAGWIAANAGFGAMTQGTISYLNNPDLESAWRSAGRGALLGAVGGVVGVASSSNFIPVISNRLVAASVSSAAAGSAFSATDAVIRVVGKGEDLATAAQEVVCASLSGAAGGAVLGSTFYGASRVVSKLAPRTHFGFDALSAHKAASFEKFQKKIEPVFPKDRAIHMGDIRNYSRQLYSHLDEFAHHLKATDPAFARHLDKFKTQWKGAEAAHDSILLAKLEREWKRGLSGELAEAKVKSIFKPFFEEVTTQRRVQNGETIIDMVLIGAKHPISIKGHRYVEKGGSLPIEVKAGSERYFQSEIESGHLMKQLSGHEEFGKGLVVTTRDVSDAIMHTGRAREIIKEAGSTPYRLLPYKSELDSAIRRLITESD